MVRILSSSLRRSALRCIPIIQGQALPDRYRSILQLRPTRTLHDQASEPTDSPTSESSTPEPSTSEPPTVEPEESEPVKPFAIERDYPIGSKKDSSSYERYFNNMRKVPPTPGIGFKPGLEVTIYGFIGKRKDLSANLSFCDVSCTEFPGSIQIVSQWEDSTSIPFSAHQDLKSIPAYSPVIVKGTIREPLPRLNSRSPLEPERRWDLKLSAIHCLNPFPKDISVSKNTVWPPHLRHLQLRFDPFLQSRLKFRQRVKKELTRRLESLGFLEVDTPVLFKSTPEGAREFLVPTRRPGYAYALVQSPQQYKQMLMAGGITKYFQFAKCFRDEDHRADRQPEFTQLDLEMAFADGSLVIKTVSSLLRNFFDYLNDNWLRVNVDGAYYLVNVKHVKTGKTKEDLATLRGGSYYPRLGRSSFNVITYKDAMSRYGSDKPDLRIRPPYVSPIFPVDTTEVSMEFIRKLTDLDDPIVEACKFRFTRFVPATRKFVMDFFKSLPSTTIGPTRGFTPAIFIYNSGREDKGMAALGKRALRALWENSDPWNDFQDGDFVIVHARRKDRFSGSSTDLGRIRKALYDAGVEAGLIPRSRSFAVSWITEFPLFTPNGDNPGQGGAAGFSSTHHPFTAPLSPLDFSLLTTRPLAVKADHYDLVINGVEVGGGSRRIHVAKYQEFIMRDILKMSEEGISEFSHLLEALRAGCPPHAGFALGLDRLVAVLADVQSVRDVTAFPKNNKGEDPLVKSPSKITAEQRKLYHMFDEPDDQTRLEA